MDLEKWYERTRFEIFSRKLLTCYQPARSKTLSGGVVMGFTFSLKMVGAKILVPGSWYQDLKFRNQRPVNWNKGCFWKFGPRIFRLYGSASFFEAHNFRKNGLPTNKDLFSGNLKVQIYGFGDIYFFENHGIWDEMGPYGSVWAHIKTGRSHMAQDHFQAPLDPKTAHKKLSLRDPNQFWDLLVHFLFL